jgi:hypothetical protein
MCLERVWIHNSLFVHWTNRHLKGHILAWAGVLFIRFWSFAEIASVLCFLTYYKNTARFPWRILVVRFNSFRVFSKYVSKLSAYLEEKKTVLSKNMPKLVVLSMYTERVMHFQQRLTNLLGRCFEEIEWGIIQYTGLSRTNFKCIK